MSDPQDVAEVAARVVAEQQWPVTVTLKRPIQFGSESIASLVFRRGKMGDLKGMKIDAMPPLDQLMLIASRLCGKPVAALELLDEEDGAEVLELAIGFFARCLGAGQRP